MEIPFGSKYFGWLVSLIIVLAAGWLLLPAGYNTLILWFAPQLGNYIRPTCVLVNALLVNPLNNWIMTAVWAIAGLVGGMIAGTKAGAFVVGLMTWLTSLVLFVFCIVQLVIGGISLGTLAPIPQGESLASLLQIPLVQSLITDLLAVISGSSGTVDFAAILAPLVIYFVVPIILIIVAAIIGAVVRPKE